MEKANGKGMMPMDEERHRRHGLATGNGPMERQGKDTMEANGKGERPMGAGFARIRHLLLGPKALAVVGKGKRQRAKAGGNGATEKARQRHNRGKGPIVEAGERRRPNESDRHKGGAKAQWGRRAKAELMPTPLIGQLLGNEADRLE